MNPDDYNAHAFWMVGPVDPLITEMVRIAQEKLGLKVDGKFGPVTRKALEAYIKPASVVALFDKDWYRGAKYIHIHPTWTSGGMTGTRPDAIVWHYTATNPGTAVAMANRRKDQYRRRLPEHTDADEGKLFDRPASWHITIDTDGTVIQMAPFTAICWHAGGHGALPIDGLGYANSVAIGIELVGHGDVFPPEQVEAAKQLARALVQHYNIDRKYAMVEHSAISPHRRSDPGVVWMTMYAKGVLDYAYAR